MADPLLSPFYDGIDMARLKHQQEKVMTLAFGGHELLKVRSQGSCCGSCGLAVGA